jgi:hypothetical protein
MNLDNKSANWKDVADFLTAKSIVEPSSARLKPSSSKSISQMK